MDDNNDNKRVLGRVLAVEEMKNVSGGWTLASAGDTSRSQDTFSHTVDSTIFSEMRSGSS